MNRNNVYTKVYTPEKWENVNQDNKNIIDDFLTEYRQQKKSENTIKQYFNDLRLIAIKIMEDFDKDYYEEINDLPEPKTLDTNFDVEANSFWNENIDNIVWFSKHSVFEDLNSYDDYEIPHNEKDYLQKKHFPENVYGIFLEDYVCTIYYMLQ